MGQEELQNVSNNLRIENISDESFSLFGKIVENYDFSEVIDYMEGKTSIPDEGNIYVASVPEMEQLRVKELLENGFYGEMPIQIGYCNGKNSTLNGLEYHMGSEINIAVTDMVLILGKLQDVVDNKYDVENTRIFFVEKGKAIQLYETTLHFSPCKTNSDGFKCIVVLPKGTNEPLDNPKTKFGDKLLFARNKWLLAHPDRKVLIDKGAYPGITGENIEIKIK